MYKYNCYGQFEIQNKNNQIIEYMTNNKKKDIPIFFQSIASVADKLKDGMWPTNKLKISGDNYSTISFGDDNVNINRTNQDLIVVNKNGPIKLDAKNGMWVNNKLTLIGDNNSTLSFDDDNVNINRTKQDLTLTVVNKNGPIKLDAKDGIKIGIYENKITSSHDGDGDWLGISNKGHLHLDANSNKGNLYISAKKILGSDQKPLIISKDIRFHQSKHFEIPGIDANEYPIAVLSSFWSNSTPNTYTNRFEIRISKIGNKWSAYCNTNTDNKKKDDIEARYTFFHKSLCEDNPSNGPLFKQKIR